MSGPSQKTGSRKRPHESQTPVSKKPRIEESVPVNVEVGFEALSNGYVNAILQAIFGLPCFSEDLLFCYLQLQNSKLETKAPLVCHMAELLRVTLVRPWSFSECFLLLQTVKENIDDSPTQFPGFQRNDVHHLLRAILGQLSSELVPISNSLRSGTKESGNKILKPTQYNFSFNLKEILQCQQCSNIKSSAMASQRFSISCPIQGDMSLQKSVLHYFRSDVIDHDCDTCQGCSSDRTERLESLPRVLIVHVKRFEVDEQTTVYRKIHTPVKVPRYLTLDPVCDSDTRPPYRTTIRHSGFKVTPGVSACTRSRAKATEKLRALSVEGNEIASQVARDENLSVWMDDLNNSDDQTSHIENWAEIEENMETGHMPNCYERWAVITHEGEDRDDGHYKCDIRNRDSDQWYRLNEENNANWVITVEGSRKTWESNGCIYFYLHRDIVADCKDHHRNRPLLSKLEEKNWTEQQVLLKSLREQLEIKTKAEQSLRQYVDRRDKAMSKLTDALSVKVKNLTDMMMEEQIAFDSEKQGLRNMLKLTEAKHIVSLEALKKVHTAIKQLQCGVCHELLMQPMTLNCSHTFCSYCIERWIKTKKDCPVCRSHVTSRNRSLALDKFIDDVVDGYDLTSKTERAALKKSREEDGTSA